jgi:hypothetical protein
MHDRATVRRFQQAHADHIESLYTGLAAIPQNPRGIEVHMLGETRVFCSNEDRLENRAILTGNESKADVQRMTSLFEERKKKCFVEVNPGNFYRTDPFSWNSEIIPILLEADFRLEAFRCVWYSEITDGHRPEESNPTIKSYSSRDLEKYIAGRFFVELVSDDQKKTCRENIEYGESSEEWQHYLGFESETPISTSTLFTRAQSGYLQWAFTHKDHRNRGHQRAHIQRRISDAFSRGCTTVFAVTDFNTSSGRNLEACGLSLAYNYVLMVRHPIRSAECELGKVVCLP